jgi:hypothetical protein
MINAGLDPRQLEGGQPVLLDQNGQPIDPSQMTEEQLEEFLIQTQNYPEGEGIPQDGFED